MSPNGSVAFYLCFWSPPKLYKMMPIETIAATNIFLGLSARFLSLTLEQKTPTTTTETILQDFTSITIGKLVR